MLIQQTVPAPLKTTLLPLRDETSANDKTQIRMTAPQTMRTAHRPSQAQHWNWAAFVLNAVWYVLHGMWLKGLVILAIEVYFGYPAVLIAALYCGYNGARDHAASRAARASAHHPTH